MGGWVNSARIDVQSRPAGSFIAPGELLPDGWENTHTLNVDSHLPWGPGQTNRYVRWANSADQITPYLQTVHESMDQEVETWFRVGRVFFRYQNGQAIAISMHADSGRIQVEGIRNVNEHGGDSVVFEVYDFIADASLLGYNGNSTEGDRWTFGISGLDLYVKYNGVLIKTFKNWGQMAPNPGKLALSSIGTSFYGFRDTAAEFFEDGKVSANLRNRLIDVTDSGVRNLIDTGSMTAGSNILMTRSDPGFKVGDRVIVEIGGEAGRGARGTEGVGGAWPKQSYADSTAREAATPPANTVAWERDTGDVYQYSAGWVKRSNELYYTSKAVPLALVSRVTAVDGRQLTLADEAHVSTSNAMIYTEADPDILDRLLGNTRTANGPSAGHPLRDWLPKGMTVRFPAGRYAVAARIPAIDEEREGWSLVGAGQGVTTIFSPRGVPSASVFVTAPNFTIRDLTLVGNVKRSGYGFNDVPEYPHGRDYPNGILFSTTRSGLITDVEVIDVWKGSASFSFCQDCWVYRLVSRMTDGLFQYMQWQLQMSDSIGGGFVDCEVRSPNMQAAFETFRSTGTVFQRIKVWNGGAAANSAGGWLMEDCEFHLEPETRRYSWSEWNPLIGINTNIQPPHPDLALGGLIRQPRVVFTEPLDENGYAPIAIVVNQHNVNVTIEGSYDGTDVIHPDLIGMPDAPQADPVGHDGAVGINSTADGTIVRNMRIRGKSPLKVRGTGLASINLSGPNSQATNCIADTIRLLDGATQTGTRTNDQYGAGP